MAFLTSRRVLSILAPPLVKGYAEGRRKEPECVILGPRPNVKPSGRPPVRIYLGTEPRQHRAERIFIWSIEQVRDPARTYEIYLMKDLVGFDRRLWLTGFTNYRFAIPHLAGGQGRAIYNDVDQIYLKDPAELFDTDMNGHGYLSITDRDTSVMLIDCARMAPLWTLDRARTRRRQRLEADARALGGLWGPLDHGWNARDHEYDAENSKLVHFTIIHTQPWRPFPDQYVYWPNPVGHLWFDLFTAAHDAGFQPFTAARPTRAYEALCQGWSGEAAANSLGVNGVYAGPLSDAAAELETLLGEEEARSIAVFEPPGRKIFEALDAKSAKSLEEMEVTHLDPITALKDQTPSPSGGARSDVAAVLGWLEHLADEDVAWTLDRLFAGARHALFAAILPPRESQGAQDGARTSPPPRDVDWWHEQFAEAATRFPDIHWKIAVLTDERRPSSEVREGGSLPGCRPSLWVLSDGKPGHTTQSVGIVNALGWTHEVKELDLPGIAYYWSVFCQRAGLPRSWSPLARRFKSSWPDVVVAAGWLSSGVARWIQRETKGRARLVLGGRKAGAPGELNRMVVNCRHFRLPPHPRRIETLLPPHQVTDQSLARANESWPDLFGDAPAPRIVLLAGGDSRSHRFDAETAGRLGREVREFAEAAGGSAFAITSRRTTKAAADALEASFGAEGRVHRWRRNEPRNPYAAYLRQADALVVTGESESMLAEAIATGKSVYIYPIPRKREGLWARLSRQVFERARVRPLHGRGTVRPQQGLEYLCARLLEREIVRPPRDIEVMHENVVRAGLARMFGAPLVLERRPLFDETVEVARRVEALLGIVPRRPYLTPYRRATNTARAG